jgi:hypothetical protein
VVALLLAGALGVRRLGYDEFAIIRSGVVLRAFDAPVISKSMFAVFVDLVIVTIAATAAVVLKTDWHLMAHRADLFGMVTALAPVTILVFWGMGLYRGTWRVAGAHDFVRASCAVLVAALLGMTVRMLLTLSPPSVALFSIYGLAAVILVTGSRASYQILASSRWHVTRTGTPTLIYGAGRKGASALRELVAVLRGALRPVGFIDDDESKAGRIVNGVPVVGSLQGLEQAMRRLAVGAVVIASDRIPPARLARIEELCERSDVSLLKIRITLDSLEAADRPVAAAPILVPAGVITVGHGAARPVEALKSPKNPLPHPIHFEDRRVEEAVFPVVATEKCPSCASRRLHRSHVRKISERLRKRFTEKRLFRCEECGWRGWNSIIDPAMYGPFPTASVSRTVRAS